MKFKEYITVEQFIDKVYKRLPFANQVESYKKEHVSIYESHSLSDIEFTDFGFSINGHEISICPNPMDKIQLSWGICNIISLDWFNEKLGFDRRLGYDLHEVKIIGK